VWIAESRDGAVIELDIDSATGVQAVVFAYEWAGVKPGTVAPA
jgi:hypothetical protein